MVEYFTICFIQSRYQRGPCLYVTENTIENYVYQYQSESWFRILFSKANSSINDL